jgi:hypothetical protein
MHDYYYFSCRTRAKQCEGHKQVRTNISHVTIIIIISHVRLGQSSVRGTSRYARTFLMCDYYCYFSCTTRAKQREGHKQVCTDISHV